MRTLRLRESYGTESENMLVHGDNLDVLSSIKSEYVGKVKCIYIDPPYNTCGFFSCFNDEMPHEDWENTMSPRLELLWELLSDDGSIWISIDDNECHYLKVLCDKLWGKQYFITTIVRQKNDAPRDSERSITHMHDYILVYSKSMAEFSDIPTLFIEDYFNNYDNDIRGKWIPETILSKNDLGINKYPVKSPKGIIISPPLGRSWLITEDEFADLLKDNRIWFGINEDEIPTRKIFFSERADSKSPTLWLSKNVGDNQEARREISSFNKEIFFYVPKPERLIYTILSIASSPGDLVLDAYLGSGTTAAVAHKMNRKWIGIEVGEQCFTHCFQRLKAVVDGDPNGVSSFTGWIGGGGFNFFDIE